MILVGRHNMHPPVRACFESLLQPTLFDVFEHVWTTARIVRWSKKDFGTRDWFVSQTWVVQQVIHFTVERCWTNGHFQKNIGDPRWPMMTQGDPWWPMVTVKTNGFPIQIQLFAEFSASVSGTSKKPAGSCPWGLTIRQCVGQCRSAGLHLNSQVEWGQVCYAMLCTIMCVCVC